MLRIGLLAVGALAVATTAQTQELVVRDRVVDGCWRTPSLAERKLRARLDEARELGLVGETQVYEFAATGEGVTTALSAEIGCVVAQQMIVTLELEGEFLPRHLSHYVSYTIGEKSSSTRMVTEQLLAMLDDWLDKVAGVVNQRGNAGAQPRD